MFSWESAYSNKDCNIAKEGYQTKELQNAMPILIVEQTMSTKGAMNL